MLEHLLEPFVDPVTNVSIDRVNFRARVDMDMCGIDARGPETPLALYIDNYSQCCEHYNYAMTSKLLESFL